VAVDEVSLRACTPVLLRSTILPVGSRLQCLDFLDGITNEWFQCFGALKLLKNDVAFRPQCGFCNCSRYCRHDIKRAPVRAGISSSSGRRGCFLVGTTCIVAVSNKEWSPETKKATTL